MGDRHIQAKELISNKPLPENTKALTKQQRYRNKHREELKKGRREQAKRARQAQKLKTIAAAEILRANQTLVEKLNGQILSQSELLKEASILLQQPE